MIGHGKELTSGLSSPSVSAKTTPTKTMVQALNIKFKAPVATNVSQHKVKAEASGAGLVNGAKGAVASVKAGAQNAKAALTAGIKAAQGEVAAAVEKTGNALPSIPRSNDDATVLAHMTADALTGNSMSIGSAVMEASGGSQSWTETAETQVRQELSGMQESGQTDMDWDAFFEAGYDVMDIMRIDPNNPSPQAIPEMQDILAIEGASLQTDVSLDGTKGHLDTQQIGLTSEGICGISKMKLTEGPNLDAACVAKIKACDSDNPEMPSLSAEFKPTASSPTIPV